LLIQCKSILAAEQPRFSCELMTMHVVNVRQSNNVRCICYVRPDATNASGGAGEPNMNDVNDGNRGPIRPRMITRQVNIKNNIPNTTIHRSVR
jgi:hypothetical protein